MVALETALAAHRLEGDPVPFGRPLPDIEPDGGERGSNLRLAVDVDPRREEEAAGPKLR
jgi:hypothetical protein